MRSCRRSTAALTSRSTRPCASTPRIRWRGDYRRRTSAMWQGVIPAVTTKFTVDDALDYGEMRRCYGLAIEAGCDGLIACGSPGGGPRLRQPERIDVLKVCKEVSGRKPSILTICEASTRDACALAERAAHAGADGLMVVPSPIYFTDRRETVAVLRTIA